VTVVNISSAPARIEVRDVSMRYTTDNGFVDVLKNISFSVGEREFVSLLGPSGCGKSTLLDLVAGLLEPTSGTVFIDGQTDRLGRSGYMQQRDLLMPWKDVADNVALALIVNGVCPRQARQRALETLAGSGLGGLGERLTHELSGGMRQRVALARTFVLERDGLLLDEPFGALDSLTRIEMQSWLLELWSRSAASVLLVTHDIDEAIRLSDRVLLMSSQPAPVTLDMTIGLPRPRPYFRTASAEFTALKNKLLSRLHFGDTDTDVDERAR
jgi:ABC-type nitrate/sulfonate/bicarbonate transport system ATPase subunit